MRVLQMMQGAQSLKRLPPGAGIEEVNAGEVLWALPGMARPSVQLGASVESALGRAPDPRELQVALAPSESSRLW